VSGETNLREWASDKDAAFNPTFFADAEAVELPEVTWRDVEDFAVESVNADLPAEEPKERQEQRRAAERQHLVNQRHYDALESQLADVVTSESLFAVTSTMGANQRAFNTVCSTYFAVRNSSMLKVSRYNGQGTGVTKRSLPNKQDFFCDVELVGKRALKEQPALLCIFLHHIIELEGEEWTQIHYKTREAIAKRVGSQYVRCGLYPLGAYFHA
jgi:hypothetical protein